MRYIKGEDRNQLQASFVCLDEMIESNNLVRVIDYFVSNLDLVGYGFTKAIPESKGRKPYDPRDLLKLYIYGYLNKINSSRRLETESKRNIELKWLLGNLSPDFKTIADFRKDNRSTLKQVFKEFTFICKSAKLLDFELTAIDGSFFSAVNHNGRNYSKTKLKRLMQKLDQQIDNYLEEISRQDNQEFSHSIELSEKLSKLKESQQKYRFLLKKLETDQETQISLTDPDSKMMTKPQSKKDVSYNVQTAVDSKQKLIAEFDVTNDHNDLKQLTRMSCKVKETYGLNRLKVTADSGYFSGEELSTSKAENIETYVPEKKSDKSDKKGKFSSRHFRYDESGDFYVCPLGTKLSYYSFDKKSKARIYANPKACKHCPSLAQCTSTRSRHRRIYRSYYAEVVEQQKQRNKQNKEIIESRKMIVEHPFGTIKRHMGLGDFLTKGLVSVNGEFSLIALSYNIKRAYNILGFDKLMAAMQSYFNQESTKTKVLTDIINFRNQVSTFLKQFTHQNDKIHDILNILNKNGTILPVYNIRFLHSL